jgi:hypothetical protein
LQAAAIRGGILHKNPRSKCHNGVVTVDFVDSLHERVEFTCESFSKKFQKGYTMLVYDFIPAS